MQSQKTTVIPIASGKGGVGKTLLTANLCIALARLGHDTVAVDLDLGGSNLYTCLGVPNKHPGIGDFLMRKSRGLNELLVPTAIPNLRFLPGEGRTPFLANISHEDRMALVREIREIKARYVVLDLGAGTLFSTLNFFGMARQGMLVTTFETPAIMNFVMFLRNFMFRVISGVTQKDAASFEIARKAFQGSIREQNLTVEQIIEQIRGVNPAMADRVRKTCSAFRPRVVFNMGDAPEELGIRNKVTAILRQGLSLEVDYFGYVFHDRAVRLSAKNREVLLARYPDSPASRGIIGIARRIVKLWDDPDLAASFDLYQNTLREARAFGLAPSQESISAAG